LFVAALVASRYDLCGWSHDCMRWKHLDPVLHLLLLGAVIVLAAALVWATEENSALYNIGLALAVLCFLYKLHNRILWHDAEYGGQMLDWLGVPQWLVDLGLAPPGSRAR
jgi:hypothetical protein